MLTFVPGTTSQTITVAVNGDTFVEPDETFGVSPTNAVNATIADGEGQASILDEDGIPAISVADTTATEGAKNAVFSVTLSTSSVGSVEVGYATFDGTAVAGADYQATSGTLVFPAGERARTVSVPLTVADDTIDQEPRTFFLTLSGPTGATIADGQATATILDDDMRTLSIDSPRVTEGSRPRCSA